MDWGDLAIAALAVLLVFIGAALTVLIEVARAQLERKQRRQDRRDDFQRQTLLDLQDTLYLLTRTLGAIHHQDVMTARRTGNWSNQLISEELNQRENESTIRLNTLSVRVDDERVRTLVDSFLTSKPEIFVAKSEKQASDAFNKMSTIRGQANDRIGELLRSL